MRRSPTTSPTTSRGRRVRAVCLIALVAVTLVPGSSAAAEGPVSTSDSGAPGDVITARPMTALVSPSAPMAANAWHILYRSTTVDGQPTEVSGTVLVPKSEYFGGPRPLIGFAVGTQGLADRCAPSQQLAVGTEYEAGLIDAMLKRGWAVAVTDYPGLGTPGDHSYVVGRALGRSVLDSMRAARRLPDAGLDADGPLAIFGYSEGGAAAGWAVQLQPDYAPDLPLAGAALGASPGRLLDLVPGLDGGDFMFLMLYTAIGYNAGYPELRLDDYLNPVGRNAVAALRETCLHEALALGQVLPKFVLEYVFDSPLDRPDWIRRLAENNLGGLAPATPVLLGAAREDQVVPQAQVRTIYREWCAMGVLAQFLDITSGEHAAGGLVFGPAGLAFLADRLDGKPLDGGAICA
jgi:hypothetical protein